MIEELKKWIFLAETDLKAAKQLLNSDESFFGTVCFHCQQAVEKYLKAYLFINNTKPKRTHNIYEILESCIKIDEGFRFLKDINIDKLTIFSMETRYPDDLYIPTLEEAKEAIELAERAKEFVLKKLVEKGYKE